MNEAESLEQPEDLMQGLEQPEDLMRDTVPAGEIAMGETQEKPKHGEQSTIRA